MSDRNVACSMRKVVLALIYLALVSATAKASTTAAGRAEIHLKGVVHGGFQAIPGSQVQIFATGVGGYGSASTPLLATPVTTAANGSFTISQAISTEPGQLLYAVATGGNPGNGENPAIEFLATLGSVPTAANSSSIVINEVTTVAAAYTLAPYATDPAHIGSTGTPLGLQGIANAFALSNLLTTGGVATAPTSQAIYPQKLINFLANGMAYCVSYPSLCPVIFGDTRSATGIAPTNTAQSLLDIAQNHVLLATGYHLLTGPFTPTLSSEPNDAAMVIQYPTGAAGSFYANLAIDGTGNVFLADNGNFGVLRLNPDTLVETFSSPNNYGNPTISPISIAIDPRGNVYAAGFNPTDNTGGLQMFSQPEGTLSPGREHDFGTDFLTAAAFDSMGNLWAADYNGDVYLSTFNQYGQWNAAGEYVSPAVENTTSLTVLPNGGLALTGTTSTVPNQIEFFQYDLANATGLSYVKTLGLPHPDYGAASYNASFDGNGNLYAATDGIARVSLPGGTVTELVSAAPAGPYPGGLQYSGGTAIDGLGNIWGVNIQFGDGNCTAFGFTPAAVPLSPPVGLGDLIMQTNTSCKYPPAIDGSGNLWATYYTNLNTTTLPGATGVLEFVGLAAPVVTPVVTALTNNQIGQRP